jgi:hypothetical protein
MLIGCPTFLDSEEKAQGEAGSLNLGKDASCSYFNPLKPRQSFESFGFSKIERLGSKSGVPDMASGCWLNSYSR